MDALELLKKLCPKNVVEHCIAVSKYAYEIALQIKNNDY
ncbi:metal dependent phosphohydrolase, partial [Methanocaldococcus villosus KIN24-T80]